MIYDAHSHLGQDGRYSLPGDLHEYLREACQKLGVREANLIPQPSPKYVDAAGNLISFEWKERAGRIGYRRLTKPAQGDVREEVSPVNPYAEYNDIIEAQLRGHPELHFVPLVHPTLDTFDHLQRVIASKPRAIKIHGIACGITPDNVSDEFLSMIGKSDVPLIIHTDFIDSAYAAMPTTSADRRLLHHMFGGNTATNWISVLKKHNVRAFLAHGCRLQQEAIDCVKGSDQFLVGIGPDLFIEGEPERIAGKGPYLSRLLQCLPSTHLAFDIDYPWNVSRRGETTFDWNLAARIKAQLSPSQLNEVLYSNAKKFFDPRANV